MKMIIAYIVIYLVVLLFGWEIGFALTGSVRATIIIELMVLIVALAVIKFPRNSTKEFSDF